MVIVLCTSHTIPTTQVYTLPLPHNLIYITLVYYWYSSSLSTVPYMWTTCMCAVLLFSVYVTLLFQLFVLTILCDCLCAYYFTRRLFIYGLFDFCTVCLTFYASVSLCYGVWLSHWIKGYLTWLDNASSVQKYLWNSTVGISERLGLMVLGDMKVLVCLRGWTSEERMKKEIKEQLTQV